MNTDVDLVKSYNLFLDQKQRFVSELRRIDKDVKITIDPKKPNINNPGNWYMGFVPSSWGDFEQGMHGVHFEFAYYYEKTTRNEYVRFSVGIENPFTIMYRHQFKSEVIEAMNLRGISLPEFTIWPNAGVIHGRKLIEYRVALDSHAWKNVIEKYKELTRTGFIGLVADFMKQYNDRGCFTEQIEFSD